MPRPKRETRNGLLYCPACERWLHPSRFRPAKQSGHGTVTTFRSKCKGCEQSARTDEKNSDRALALVKQRAQVRAQAAGVPLEFFMDDLNWKSLVPLVRACLEYPDATCRNCGHPFMNERDIQLEHVAPPRFDFPGGPARDFARHHARNITVLCGSCNGSKQDAYHEGWCDAQEDVRLSVASYYGMSASEPVRAPEDCIPEWIPHANGTVALFR